MGRGDGSVELPLGLLKQDYCADSAADGSLSREQVGLAMQQHVKVSHPA